MQRILVSMKFTDAQTLEVIWREPNMTTRLTSLPISGTDTIYKEVYKVELVERVEGRIVPEHFEPRERAEK